MRYRTLGRTGIAVGPFCLGTMMFGGSATLRRRPVAERNAA